MLLPDSVIVLSNMGPVYDASYLDVFAVFKQLEQC